MSDTDEPVLVETRGKALFIILNRPRALNAQNQAMREAIVGALDELDQNPALRVGVLTSEGGRAFSAGADLKEISAGSDGGVPARRVPVEQRPAWIHFRRLEQVRKPLLAAIDGYAVGGGLEVALLCDIRVATKSSSFGLPEPRNVGGVAEVAVHRLSRMIPMGEALYLHLTASTIPARRAYEIGLIQHVAADREAMFEEVDRIVGRICECAPDALVWGKLVARNAPTVSVSQSEALLHHLQQARDEGH